MKKLIAIVVIVSIAVGYSMGWLSSNWSVLNAVLVIAAVCCGAFLLLAGPVDKTIE